MFDELTSREKLEITQYIKAAMLLDKSDGDILSGVIEKAGKWDKDSHPRDRFGKFISKLEIAAAKRNPVKAAELRERVKPADAEKLNNAISSGGHEGRPSKTTAHPDVPAVFHAGVTAESHEDMQKHVDDISKNNKHLDAHDAITGALRGEHGKAVKDAVDAALDDWHSHQGKLGPKYLRVMQELAKLNLTTKTNHVDHAQADKAARPLINTHESIRRLLKSDDPGKHIRIAKLLAGHTRSELRMIRDRLGLEVPTGRKAAMIAAIATKAAGRDDAAAIDDVMPKPRMSVEEAEKHVRAAMAAGGLKEYEGRRAIADIIQNRLTTKDIGELKKRLGMKASGTKKEMADRIAMRARDKAETSPSSPSSPDKPSDRAVTQDHYESDPAIGGDKWDDEGEAEGDAVGAGPAKAKEPHEMTRAKHDALIASYPGNSLADTKTHDWGNLRGQGRRSGGMILGGMRDSSLQGKRSYTDIVGKLPQVEYDEAKLLDKKDQLTYVRAREAGFDHRHAIGLAYESISPGFNAHKETVASALAAGKHVPPEVLADYPDLAAKYGGGAPASPSRASLTSPAMMGRTEPQAGTGNTWMPGATTQRKPSPTSDKWSDWGTSDEPSEQWFGQPDDNPAPAHIQAIEKIADNAHWRMPGVDIKHPGRGASFGDHLDSLSAIDHHVNKLGVESSNFADLATQHAREIESLKNGDSTPEETLDYARMLRDGDESVVGDGGAGVYHSLMSQGHAEEAEAYHRQLTRAHSLAADDLERAAHAAEAAKESAGQTPPATNTPSPSSNRWDDEDKLDGDAGVPETTPPKPAAKPKAAPAPKSSPTHTHEQVNDLFSRSGRVDDPNGAKNSELNAAARSIMAMKPSEAMDLAKKLGFASMVSKSPAKLRPIELARHFLRRRGAAVNFQITNIDGTPKELKAVSDLYHRTVGDEELIDPRDGLAEYGKAGPNPNLPARSPAVPSPHTVPLAAHLAAGGSASAHRAAVVAARDAGQQIPPAVQADYPELNPAYNSSVNPSTPVDNPTATGNTTGVGTQSATPKPETKTMDLPSNVTDVATHDGTAASHKAAREAAKADRVKRIGEIADAIGADDDFKKWASSPLLSVKLERPVIEAGDNPNQINRELHTPRSRERAYLGDLKRTIEKNSIEEYKKYLPAIDSRIAALSPQVVTLPAKNTTPEASGTEAPAAPKPEGGKMELPALKGSEKQIAYANDMRAKFLDPKEHHEKVRHIAEAMLPVVGDQAAIYTNAGDWLPDGKAGFGGMFASKFGLKPGNRSYRIIENKINIADTKKRRGSSFNPTIQEDDTNDMIADAGSREKAEEIANAFGFKLSVPEVA